ncbi:hypothetical protein LWM68_21140 [Niabella sp. W65]|nr:hypothetical protein [Niabella sp. W65]MCH7365039.1 hypothetical protein [Niabella sp. W65]ULT40852.1 hypothetical protein KRR40_40020 [Niabella sp. I65]
MSGYYGSAAKEVKAILDLLDEKTQHSPKVIGLFDEPLDYSSDFLSSDNLQKYYSLIEDKIASSKNSHIVNRLNAFIAPFDYVYLLQSVNNRSTARQISQVGSGRLNRLATVIGDGKAPILGETFAKSDDFLRDFRNIANMPDRLYEDKSLALNKPITLKYPSSAIHAGDAALVDGIRALLGVYQNSWVVFTQGQMDVTIDLQKTLKVQSVTACFGRAPSVNIELPDKFDVSYSSDNTSFSKWGNWQ